MTDDFLKWPEKQKFCAVMGKNCNLVNGYSIFFFILKHFILHNNDWILLKLVKDEYGKQMFLASICSLYQFQLNHFTTLTENCTNTSCHYLSITITCNSVKFNSASLKRGERLDFFFQVFISEALLIKELFPNTTWKACGASSSTSKLYTSNLCYQIWTSFNSHLMSVGINFFPVMDISF